MSFLSKSPLSKYKYKREYTKFIIAAFVFWVAICSIKMVYNAEMVDIIEHYGATKAEVSTGLTLYYFAYAVGQLLFAMLVGRIDMRKCIVLTTLLSAVSYGIVGLTTELWQLWVILCLNGFLHSSTWGGISYFVARVLPNDSISYANKLLSAGLTVGMAVTYGMSGFFVAYLSWKATFIFFAVVLFLSTLWLVYQEKRTEDCVKRGDEIPTPEVIMNNNKFVVPSGLKLNAKPMLRHIMLASFLVNCIGYGVANWIPNLLKEVHMFPNHLSILLTFMMPIVSLPCSFVMYTYFDKKGNVFLSGIVTGTTLLGIVLALALGYNASFLFAIILCILFKFVQGCYSNCYSSNTMMKLKYYIDAGRSAFLINAAASLGAGLMPLFTGVVLDKFGWRDYYIVMAGITLVSLAVSVISYINVHKNKILKKWF